MRLAQEQSCLGHTKAVHHWPRRAQSQDTAGAGVSPCAFARNRKGLSTAKGQQQLLSQWQAGFSSQQWHRSALQGKLTLTAHFLHGALMKGNEGSLR